MLLNRGSFQLDVKRKQGMGYSVLLAKVFDYSGLARRMVLAMDILLRDREV